MEDFAIKAKSGASWVAISQVARPVWEFVVGIILARMLTPKDFGIVAMGMIFFSLASAISSLSITNVIIQKDKLERADILSAQTIAVGSGALMCFFLQLMSPLLGMFFKEPLAGTVLSVFSVNFIINGITIIPVALMTRKMQFRALSIIEIFGSFAYGFSALALAYFGFGLWSLVYSPIVSALLTACAICFAASYIPKFGWQRSSGIFIFKFGGTLSFASILNYVARNVDYFMVGKFLGATQLGVYKRAYDLAVIPKEKVAESISGIFFPFACKIRDDKRWTKSAFLKTSKAISFVCFPVLIFFNLSAAEIIDVLYGANWKGAVHAFKIISLGGMFYCLIVPFGGLLLTYGKVKLYSILQVAYATLLLVGSAVGVNFGIEGLATAVSITLLAYLLISIRFVQNIFPLSFADYLRNIQLPVCISTTIVIVIFLCGRIVSLHSTLLNLIINSALAAVVFFLYFILASDNLVLEFKAMAFDKLAQARRMLVTTKVRLLFQNSREEKEDAA